MPKRITRYIPLDNKELTAIREGKFELHCFKMRLEQIKEGGLVFTGPGLIRQSSNGQLHFTLYAKQLLSSSLIFSEWADYLKTPAGTIVPEAEFYRLIAVDAKGREWISTRIDPDKTISDNGTLLSGSIVEMQYPSTHKRSGDLLYLELFNNVEIPFNERTTISKDVAGSESKSSSLDVLKFESLDMIVTARKEQGALILTVVSSKHDFLPDFEVKVIEALQFVLAKPFNWSTMIKLSGNKSYTVIRSRQDDRLSYRTNPPIWIGIDDTKWFTSMFTQYLCYTLAHTESKVHPVSAQVRAVLVSGAGAVETRSLVLSVAVESILEHVVEVKEGLSADDKTWVGQVQEFLSNWKGPDHLKNRLNGFIGQLHQISATSRLLKLSEQDIINHEQIQAWKTLRNKLAHGGTLSGTSLQEFLDLYHVVLVLFYRIIFHAIEYNGKYTDYSTSRWPTRDFPEPKPAADVQEEKSDSTAN